MNKDTKHARVKLCFENTKAYVSIIKANFCVKVNFFVIKGQISKCPLVLLKWNFFLTVPFISVINHYHVRIRSKFVILYEVNTHLSAFDYCA